MRILQVTPTYYPELQYGGPAQKIHHLSLALVARGHIVDVLTGSSQHPLSRGEAILDGVHVHYVPHLGKTTRLVPLDPTVIASAVHSADIVHCYGLYNLLCPVAAATAHTLRRPYFLEPLGMYAPRARSLRAKAMYHTLFTSWMAKWAKGVIATSQTELSDLQPLVEDDRLFLRGNGIDVAHFQNLPAGSSFRLSLGIQSHERLVVFIGRISPIKNLEQLILAFRDAGIPGARLLLIGPSLERAYTDTLRALIRELNLNGRVEIVGPLYGSAHLAALSAADLLVLPSLSESFGNVAAEAVVAGVPVLLTDTCGIAPLIHGKAGLAVAVGQASIAFGLRQMLVEPSIIEQVTSERQYVSEQLSWERPADYMVELYESAIRDG